ncbi:MAG: FliI/YscN family ATPase [Mesorhizobium sp.]|uniref:FliI/YscN family ATPase n=1 Tax=unclassified Mesorhizobium TaxID=325217 RepID=UPI000F758E51|nr:MULTISPECIES: FliI/YscN family ATPase [unclassified Mesorhizobium]AZO48763.1 FliI/YscN family ATPase [Mesorhizobium sp. M4B.F.Ca.ET.058.02.1.1]RVC46739.1 FliI/YscN family ATPase [Mesorhizobium sp. M4A.F.Ca.ET.090.04.2.1]RWC57085.1 MAG: FliI/YscN family ATPase [Mesorhizobium sp.]RWD15947.1 MAG: FliI/YscN family ATPase [Mesorhizobium sp.]RWD55117.1 MAG: FliI/YscN family ATPase [Mesorhizobium sp.]
MTAHAAEIENRLASIIPGLRSGLRDDASRPRRGRVRRVTGTVIHATVEEARIGEICELVDPRTGRTTKAEVVGLMDEMAILVPLGDLTGLSSLTEVVATGKEQLVPVGPGLLGRVISALGEPLDGEPLSPDGIVGSYPVNAYPPSPLERSLISEPIQLGIRALDGLLTCARGQRVGIFGEPGVGKSILLSDIVSGTDADVAVVALVGERGREVREFLEHQLGPEGRQRAIVVVATSDRPAIERVKAAYVATSIAEYFRDQGKHVLLAMDNITRFARAQREIGLASGEPPTRRGFPSSLFAVLPRLLERSGPGRVGSITSLYSVLLEGDGTLDPVAEEIQALLDGHVFLSNELAQRNHFPAIDVLRSRSRLMDAVVPPVHRADASRLRELLARYADIELLLRVGEYEKGGDAVADEAVAKIDAINAFLRQASATHESIEKTRQRMREIAYEGA